jgi:hypothetical protein
MRSKTVRNGLRFIAGGVLCIILATFFTHQISRYLFLGLADEDRLAMLGFFAGGMSSAWGILIAAAGVLQSGAKEMRVRLAPTILLLFALISLFFVLTYKSFTAPPAQPQLQPGESINI